jgi:hypothetical protein
MRWIRACLVVGAMALLPACGNDQAPARNAAPAEPPENAPSQEPPRSAKADSAAPVPAEFPVRREGSLSGFGNTEVEFPAEGVEVMPRIVESDGGYLDLARSPDGRMLWVRRWWDDGSTDVNRFELESRPGARFRLQFVDGDVEERDSSVAGAMGISVLREGDRWFEQLLRAWVVDTATDRIRRPNSGEWYPLVAAPGTPAEAVPERLQWMVFLPACSETGSACVYYGDPGGVCGRYMDQAPLAHGQGLWIAPKERCGKHW